MTMLGGLGGQNPFHQKQFQAATTCPRCSRKDCLLHSLPVVPAIAAGWGKCMACNAFWEISPAGVVTLVIAPEVTEVCPKCIKPFGKTAAHACKSPMTTGGQS